MSAAQIRTASLSRAAAPESCAGALDDHSINAAQPARIPEARIAQVSGR
jgi:hypothetical protein